MVGENCKFSEQLWLGGKVIPEQLLLSKIVNGGAGWAICPMTRFAVPVF
jgi:hypothetical protein